MSVLAATGLGLRLGGRRVLDGVDVAFRRGRVTALLGPNGAGKSSLLACLAGLRTPDAGTATLDGRAIAALDRRERGRRIGLLPQAADVHWDIDVATLVGLGRFPHRAGWGWTDRDRAAVARAMAATDVAHLAERGVERLSGGERGRVLLARVLAGEPEWLLVDEPLASLDPAHQLDVLALLREVTAGGVAGGAAAGAGVILVLHDLNLAGRAADDVVLLAGGRVIAAGEADAVLTAPLIARAYGVTVEVARSGDGRRVILPIGRAD